MEKVKVSKEVADFIESCKTYGDVNWENALLEQRAMFANAHNDDIKDNAKCMLQYSTWEVAQMLVNGYEVEKTQEEQLQAIYAEEKRAFDIALSEKDTECQFVHHNFIRGMIRTLNVLGVEIEGINK